MVRRIGRPVKRRLDQWRTHAAPPAPADPNADRLVRSPIFLFSSERSGSTLLRMILDSHSEVYAPSEMHLRALKVNVPEWFAKAPLKQFHMKSDDVTYLLWDRMLHLRLIRSGKSSIVDKTPFNTYLWRQLSKSWPEARYVFLRRHPVHIYDSLAASRPDIADEQHYEKVNQYARAWAQARAALPGPTISYEELSTEPEPVVRTLCRALGIRFEPAMLDYGASDHGGFQRGLGDWSAKIKSGVIQPTRPMPSLDEIPEELREACRLMGYLDPL
jgi:hypothetical protein